MLSIVAVERVDKRSLVVRGLDAINDTQVLDIKPVYSWSGPRSELRVAKWSEELGENYF
jgi:tRNA (Thr-GGU) A37 N-methylase